MEHISVLIPTELKAAMKKHKDSTGVPFTVQIVIALKAYLGINKK